MKLSEEIQARDHEEVEGIRFPQRFIVLARHKSFLVRFTLLGALLSLVIAFLLPSRFTANLKILPPQQNQSAAALAMLSQLGPLAAAFGKGLDRNPSDVYIAIMRSRTVADSMVDRFNLVKVYGVKLREDARRKLDENTEIRAEKDGVIAVSVEDRDSQRAADMANAYVDELQKLSQKLAVTEAGKRRLFLESEVKKASDDLANAEQAMRKTQEQTGIIQLDSQSKASMEAIVGLRAMVAAKEVQVQSMKSFATAENADLVRAEQELIALRGQVQRLESGQGGIGDVPLEKVPSAGLAYIRALREVKYREALFELLTKQYEVARIDEARDPSVIQVMDAAVPPESPSWPRRSVIVLIGLALTLLLAIMGALALDFVDRAKKDPAFMAQLETARFYLRGRSKS